ncbi:MAG: hypothetical protein ACOC5K_02070 [Chloroflexota bacterium]
METTKVLAALTNMGWARVSEYDGLITFVYEEKPSGTPYGYLTIDTSYAPTREDIEDQLSAEGVDLDVFYAHYNAL